MTMDPHRSLRLAGEPAEEPPRSGARPPALLALGFRPFFLLAGALATAIVPLWLLVFFGKIALPARLAPASWHAHEMIFGFAAAVIAGFLLTAARNWTSLPTPSGARLAALVGLWALGRVAIFWDGVLPRPLVAAVDLAFLPAVALAIGIPIVKAKSWRNLGFVPLLLLLGAANLAFHGWPSVASRAVRFALDVVLVIVAVMGGRVIPSFTANALRLEIPKRPALDRAAVASTMAVAILELVPEAVPLQAIVAIGAGALHGARMLPWRSFATRARPILWVLHLGYAWLALGLVLQGVAFFVPHWIPSAPLHALAVGAIATLILGMTTRVGLGHTGRLLEVSPAIVIAYVLLTIAALVRGVGPLVAPTLYAPALVVSGVAWALAFAIFTIVYLPILIAPRVDGKPG